MRHYHRVSYRHLDDSERYRDYDYLGDDAWVGPNERVPHGAVEENQAPWSTLGGYETGALLDEHALDARRGHGRDHGPKRDDDDYDRGYARSPDLTYRLEPPREGFAIDQRTRRPLAEARARAQGGLRGLRDMRDVIRHPGSFVRRMVTGLFHGRGPKNWMRSDTRVHDEVCELLAAHSDIDATDIEVEVKDGEVTLTGVVPDRRTKRLAEGVLDAVMGVHDVHNRLKVGAARSTEAAS